jgi:hypothetical protein
VSPDRRAFGTVFERERARIGAQVFGSREPRAAPVTMNSLAPPSAEGEPRNYIIACALAVLADGKPHDADDILAEGLNE